VTHSQLPISSPHLCGSSCSNHTKTRKSAVDRANYTR